MYAWIGGGEGRRNPPLFLLLLPALRSGSINQEKEHGELGGRQRGRNPKVILPYLLIEVFACSSDRAHTFKTVFSESLLSSLILCKHRQDGGWKEHLIVC